MLLPDFEYFTPRSLREALELIAKFGDEAKVLAGGQSLIPLMKLGLVQPRYVIDLKGVKDLSYIRSGADTSISIGGLTTHSQIEKSEMLAEKLPILTDATRVLGHMQVRNRGTIGGSLSHADPAADLPAVMLACDAIFVLEGLKGSRKVHGSEFFKDAFTTALASGEILREIIIPWQEEPCGSAYLKLSMGPGDFAIVGSAVHISIDGGGRCRGARIALGGVAERPIRAKAAEEALNGKAVNSESILMAAESTKNGLNPPTDLRASSEYRLRMASVLTKRALTMAYERARSRQPY